MQKFLVSNGTDIQDVERTHRVSDNGRTCFAGSPSRLVRSFTSHLYIVCASPTHILRKRSCLEKRCTRMSAGVATRNRGMGTNSLLCLILNLRGDRFGKCLIVLILSVNDENSKLGYTCAYPNDKCPNLDCRHDESSRSCKTVGSSSEAGEK